MTQHHKIALTIPEAAQRLSVTEKHVRRLIDEGELYAPLEGNRYIIPVASVDGWLHLRMRRAGFGHQLDEAARPGPTREGGSAPDATSSTEDRTLGR